MKNKYGLVEINSNSPAYIALVYDQGLGVTTGQKIKTKTWTGKWNGDRPVYRGTHMRIDVHFPAIGGGLYPARAGKVKILAGPMPWDKARAVAAKISFGPDYAEIEKLVNSALG